METEVKRIVKVSPVKKQTPMTNLAENGMYPGISKYISPTLDKYGGIKTGLTKEDEDVYGAKLGQDLSKNSSFWHDFAIRITSKGIFLDLDNPMDAVKLLVLKASPEVANSVDDITPRTIFVIEDEIEDARRTAKKFDYLIEAYKHIADMAPSDRRDFIKLFGARPNNLVDDGVKTKLKELADTDAKAFCAQFEDKHKSEKILLADLIDKNVLRKNGAAYVYNDEVIGGNLELTIAYIKDSKNQSTLIAMKNQLEEKLKFN